MTKTTFRVIGAGAVVFLLPALVLAATFHSGDTVSIHTNAGENIADDVYAAGGTVTVAGSIGGDLYAGGGTVLLSGSVQADAVIGGVTVTVIGSVGDDLRVGGGTILVQGPVGGDVVMGGGQIHLAGSRIGGDVLIGGGMITIESLVGQDVKAGGGEVYINAPIQGNVEIEAEKITLGSKAVISGNFTYKSPNEAVIEQGAEVQGQTTYTPTTDRNAGAAALAAFVSLAMFVKLLMLLTGALVFGLVFRRYSTHVVHSAFSRPWPEIARGLATLILLPVLSILLMVTVIGIPLGILGMISFVALMIFSWLMAPVLLGSFIYQWIKKGEYVVNWKSILIGVFAYVILSALPFVGWLMQFALMLLTIGTVVNLKWRLLKEWR